MGKKYFWLNKFQETATAMAENGTESDGKGNGGEEEKVLPDMHASRANHSTHYCIMKEVKKQFPTHVFISA